MNPAFIIIILIRAIALWFFLSGAFKPVGRILHNLWNNAKGAMNENSEEKEDE